MKAKLFRRIIGIILLPFLYIRYTFILFIPLFFIIDIPTDKFFLIWFLYAVFFGFIMGNCGVMKYWTMLFEKIFKIEYDITGKWCNNTVGLGSIYSHPILKVRGKTYNVTLTKMGNALYEEHHNLRRKAIFLWFLG